MTYSPGLEEIRLMPCRDWTHSKKKLGYRIAGVSALPAIYQMYITQLDNVRNVHELCAARMYLLQSLSLSYQKKDLRGP